MEQENWKSTPKSQSVDSLLHNLLFIFAGLGKIKDNIVRK